MKGRILILLAACAMVFASCSTSRIAVSSPDVTQLNITMDDLEYLGESEISIEYRKYLGIFRYVDLINGEVNDRQETKTLKIASDPLATFHFPDILNRAAYKLAEEYPTADYYRVVNTQKKANRLFLGGHYEVRAKVKAYRLK